MSHIVPDGASVRPSGQYDRPAAKRREDMFLGNSTVPLGPRVITRTLAPAARPGIRRDTTPLNRAVGGRSLIMLRFTKIQPRELTDNDFRTDGKPKVIVNPTAERITAPTRFTPPGRAGAGGAGDP